MLDGLIHDDGEPPSVGLVPPGTSWADVYDHIKIAHDFLLVQEADGEYAGAYWTGTEHGRRRRPGPRPGRGAG